MNILITGSQGFIGSHIVDELVKHDIQFKRFVGDCERFSEWQINLNCGQTFTHMIHCAGFNGGIAFSNKYPADIFGANTSMCINALKSCYTFKIKNFLSFVTSCGYPNGCRTGNADNARYGEWEYLDGKPDESIEAHGYAKRNLLLGCKYYHKQYGIMPLVLCPNTVFGPRDRIDERSKVLMALLKKFIDAKITNKPSVTILGTGTPLREFTYVKHVSQIVGDWIRSPQTFSSDGQPINIGPSVEMSISNLAYTIAEKVNYSGDILFDVNSPDGASRKALNYAKQTSTELLPKKTYSFNDALEETIKWYTETIGLDWRAICASN